MSETKIPDQKAVWNRKHGDGDHESFHARPSTLAEIVEPKLMHYTKILELGCGVGRDAAFFARNGHDVTATDFSDVVIERNKKMLGDLGIRFQVVDMQQPLPYEDESFDMVFANLSLHYYTDEDTRKIISDIARVLRPNGLLAFVCKSVNDFHYGNGEEVEENLFVGKSGHVRHLFSEDYARDLIEGAFDIELLEEVTEVYSDDTSVMIRCLAEKTSE